MLRLAGCDWIRNHQVVLIVGATGTGKSCIACALAHAACRRGLSTRYFRLSRLLDALALAGADGSYPKLLDRLAKTQLLSIDDYGRDDYGMVPLNNASAEISSSSSTTATARGARSSPVSSPSNTGTTSIESPPFVDAILDRLVHHAHCITLKRTVYAQEEAGIQLLGRPGCRLEPITSRVASLRACHMLRNNPAHFARTGPST